MLSNNCPKVIFDSFQDGYNPNMDEMWDRQIEADLISGKLDHLIAPTEADIAANQVKNLDEILNNS